MPEPSGAPSTYPTTTMNKLANLCCFIMAAAVFAMIGLDAGNQPGMTHSGTQQLVRHD